jgi:6-pyruvoyltetrahydropterin/6-carboxytetrahydropterin synthase
MSTKYKFVDIKQYDDIPFAHRQHKHTGHCRFIHGHNWSFRFTFGATEMDECGFVVDFGKLKWLKDWLEANFDHKLVLNVDDPMVDHLKKSLGEIKVITPSIHQERDQLADFKIVPNCGAEGLAEYIAKAVEANLVALYEDRVHLISLQVFEDQKNSVIYYLNE